MKTLYPLTFQRVPLGLVIRNVPISNAPIKGEMSREPGERLAPAFSASGQDVWMPEELAQLNNPALVISAVGARCGKVFKQESNEPWGVVANTAVYSPGENSDLTFLWYQVNDENFWVRGGSAQPYVQFDRSLQQRIFLPPLETQQRIADYLDRETAEIDAAVADLDKYVELLEKRKRAVGSALLNEALEDESTLMVHLGSLGTFISGTGFPHDYQGIEDEEYPFYKVGSLAMTNGNEVIGDTRNTVSKETALNLGAKIIPRGSVLMAKIGEAMRLCRFAVNATDCCIDNNMMAIVPRFEHITTTYLRLAITLVTVDVLVNPGPVPSLNVQGLRMFSIPLPSLEIQERLTDEWKKETSAIDSLIAESIKLRDLLLKRRSVLITEVVTGRKQV